MNRFLHGLITVGKGIEKGAVVTERVIGTAAEIVAPIVPAVAPLTILLPVPKGDNNLEVEELRKDYAAMAAPESPAPVQLSMLEIMAVNLMLSVLQSTIKNPGHAAALKAHMLLIADDIYMTYQIVPPAHA